MPSPVMIASSNIKQLLLSPSQTPHSSRTLPFAHADGDVLADGRAAPDVVAVLLGDWVMDGEIDRDRDIDRVWDGRELSDGLGEGDGD